MTYLWDKIPSAISELEKPYYKVCFSDPKHILHDIGHGTTKELARQMAREITSSMIINPIYNDTRNKIKSIFGINEVCSVLVFQSDSGECLGQWEYVPNPPH